jgi:nucleoside-diphosphate-sugar epimerase
MCEIALADHSRRGALDGIAVRLPGIVARPFGGTSTKSAFISDIFHALARGDAFTSPVSTAAHFWVLSVARCVDNLLHAAHADLSALPSTRAVTLPALRLSVPELAEALIHATRRNASLVSYAPDPEIEAVFGRYPPLVTRAADALGFRNDGSADSLVETVLRELEANP